MISYRVPASIRFGLALAALAIPSLDIGPDHTWRLAGASAQSPEPAEKQAFEAAKELGTVEAWDAFLSNYPKGFHADLARAYVKKLSEREPESAPPAAAPAVASPPSPDDFPVEAGSWGGVVRNGPGQNYRRTDSLAEGEPVTLMARSDVFENGYPWFKIAYQNGGSGYQWGGILCAIGNERPDLFKICPAATRHTPASGTRERKETHESKEKTKPFMSKLLDDAKACSKNGGEWDGRRCRPAGYFGTPKKKTCPSGQYLNQNGVCQPNETGN